MAASGSPTGPSTRTRRSTAARLPPIPFRRLAPQDSRRPLRPSLGAAARLRPRPHVPRPAAVGRSSALDRLPAGGAAGRGAEALAVRAMEGRPRPPDDGAILEFDRVARAVRVACQASETGLGRFTELSPAADGGAWVGGVGGLLHLGLDGARRGLAIGPRWRTDSVLKIRDVAGRLFAATGTGRAVYSARPRWRHLARARALDEARRIRRRVGRAGRRHVDRVDPRRAGFDCRCSRAAAAGGTWERTRPSPGGCTR